MYEPETSITGFGDSVLVLDSTSRVGYRVGRYTGNARPESESFEIKVLDFYTDEVDHTSFYHKEDLYENTEENAERLKALAE